MKLKPVIILFLVVIVIINIILNYEYISNVASHNLSMAVPKEGFFNKHRNKHEINNELSLCSNKIGKFYVFNSDKFIGRALSLGNVWEEFMHKYFKKYSDMNKIALDVGANIGTHSIVLSKYYKKVFAFEPLFYELLEKNLELNNINNVDVSPFGLSDKKSKSFIKRVNSNPGASYIDSEKGSESVDLNSLDNLSFENPICFMKIDVEGHELELINGAKETILKNKPVIIIEIKNKKAYYLLESLGYSIKKICGEDYLCVPK
jgi:FkbM family methyltransferase